MSVFCRVVDDERWLLSILDTGRGIRTDKQEEIFSPYVRAGDASTYLADSSGLALTIVSKLLELLKGEISLVSCVGEGSTFSVMFPLELKMLKLV